MLSVETKRKIDNARDVLVGKIPNPQAQIEQITTALIYKFMDDMDEKSKTLGGKARFFVGEFEKYSWRTLLDPRIGGQERMNLYSEAVQRLSQNANLPQIFRDVFKDAFVPYRDPETLSLFLKEINWFDYHHSEELGNAYEYLLSIMSSQGDAGQFRTPRHIIDFIVAAVDPQKDESILDPACGTAGFLISAYKHIIGANDGLDDITGAPTEQEERLKPEERAKLLKNFHGYDIDPGMVRLSLVNMYLHGFVMPNIEEYDSLTYEDRWNDDFDVILANPPFMTPKGGVRPHKRFQIQANRSEVLFVDYIAEHLKPHGRAGIIVPEGIIFQKGTAYKDLRKMLVDETGLWAIVSLPVGVFQPYSGVKTSILLIDKNLAKKNDNLLFIEIKHDGTQLGASRRLTEKNDLPDAIKIIKKWQDGEFLDTKLASLVPKQSIASNQYDLSLNNYKDLKTYDGEYNYVELSELLIQEKSRAKEDSYPVWSVSNTLGFVKDGSQFNHKISSDNTSNYKVVKKGFFAYNPSRINVGSIALNQHDSDGIVSPMYEVFSTVKEQLDEEYLFKLLKSKLFNNYVKENVRGGVRQQLKFDDLKKVKIPLPPLEVQSQIVSLLNGYQEIIDSAKVIIANYIPSININPDWPFSKLGEVCEVKSGGTPSRTNTNYWNGDIPWYSSGELNDLYTTKPKECITASGISSSNATLFPAGSLLIGMYDTAAFKMSLLDREASFNQAICGVKPCEAMNLEFLYYYFSQHKQTYLSKRLGVRQLNLSKGFIADLEIPHPSLKDQEAAIAEIKKEVEIIDGVKLLVEKYDEKIQAKIVEVWGE